MVLYEVDSTDNKFQKFCSNCAMFLITQKADKSNSLHGILFTLSSGNVLRFIEVFR